MKQFLHQHWKSIAVIVPLVALAGLNLFAYNHAHAMLNFTEQGSRTVKPEELSFWQKVGIMLTGITVPKPANDRSPDAVGLPFETHTFTTTDDLTLEGWYLPHAEPRGVVVMFHGYALSKAALLPEAQAFHEMGYSVLLVDFRGSGGSEGNRTSIGYYEAEDVAQAVAYAQSLAPEQPTILYGQSMGGVAILRAVAHHQVQADAIIIEGVFDRMLSTVQNRFDTMGIPSFPGANLLIFWGGQQQGFDGFSHNPVEYAPHVTAPVLMLHGSDDPRATLAQGEAVFANLGGEHTQFVTLEGIGHEPYLESSPALWRESVTQFLDEIVPAR